MNLAVKEKYSKRELERQIDSGLFERVMLSNQKLSPVAREIHPSISDVFRDTYVLDFLDLPSTHLEKDLRKGIVQNLKKIVLEFGKYFSFLGEEYRVQVGGSDFYIDLLFYHRGLQCLVAFELKISDFKPGYVGQMEFYLEALDRDVKKEYEKPSVGIILCTGKDSKVVEYALSRTLSPTLVSQYQTELIDKNLLAQKLDEFLQVAQDSKDNNQNKT